MSQKIYRVEELHRGEWQPLIAKDKKGKKSEKTVAILEENAAILNGDSKETRIRYKEVKAEKPESKAVKK